MNMNMPNYQMKPNYNLKLSQAYIPYQQYRELFDCQKALYKGTIFKELYQPYVKVNPYK